MDDETKLAMELEELTQEHKRLEKQLKAAIESHECDQIEIQRLKKRKLVVKDRIAEIYEILYPDIIA